MNEKKTKKICIAASAGGHLSEMLKVVAAWQDTSDHFYVSTSSVARDKLSTLGRTYIVGECNREHPFLTIKVALKCWHVAWKERPNIVLSTGAAPAFLLCLFCKCLGSKIVWLDSIANTEKLSLSGRLAYHFADLTLSQWPSVAEKYKGVEYCGEVL